MSDILISQTWFHIEAIYYPHPCHRIRHVMDVLVPVELDSSKKNNRFLYPLAKPFAEVRVYARNDKKNEIGFIEVSNGIVLSLQYNNFPKIEENSLEYYHIKLEVEYLKIDIGMDKEMKQIYEGKEIQQVGKDAWGIYQDGTLKSEKKLKRIQMYLGDFWRCKFNVNLIFYIPIPEIYLTLPPNWRIGDISIYKDHLSPNKSEGSRIKLFIGNVDVKTGKKDQIELEDPFISRADGAKRKYSISTTKNGYMKYVHLFGLDTDKKTTYSCTILHYVAEISTTITIFSLFPPICFIILSYSVGVATYSNLALSETNVLGVLGNCISFSIVYLAYCYTYITLKDKGYDIPHRLLYRISSLIVLITILLCIGAIMAHLITQMPIKLNFNIIFISEILIIIMGFLLSMYKNKMMDIIKSRIMKIKR